MMSEYKVHHHVGELFKLLNVPEKSAEGLSAEVVAEVLLKSQTPNISSKVSSHAAVRKLAEIATSSDTVLEKYDHLKSRNAQEIDSMVSLLAQIASDEKTKQFLRKHSEDRATHHNASVGNMHVGNNRMAQAGLTRSSAIQEKRDSSGKKVSALCIPKEQSNILKNLPAGIPQIPPWVKERPHFTWDFPTGAYDDDIQHVGPIGALPLSTQEDLLIENILCCLSGADGNYVTAHPRSDSHGQRTFSVDESIDPSLKELVKRILPLCSHFSTVICFTEEKSQFEYGLVNHALAAAMRQLLKDYFVLIAQLEHQHRQGSLSMQKLWFYLQPTMRNMEVLASTATSINKGYCFGGMVLSVLHAKTASLTGDPKAQELCLYLTQAACVPYFEILEKWIYKGIISDPYSEFLVEDKDRVQKEEVPVDYNDDYWKKRYIIRREQIPVFLEKVASMILQTGKYLNVIRQCGHNIRCPDAKPISYTIMERQYVESIEVAYNFASKKLLDLLMEGSDLMGRLRSVKHYFLMDQGDFIVQFMDMAGEELAKNMDDIMPTRLESLLELALRTSVVNSDKYKDDIRVELLPYDLLSQMFKIICIQNNDQKESGPLPDSPPTGLEAFAFDYDVKWPLSLVINKTILACYQMLFRHLLYCKHVERLLGNVWSMHKVAKTFSLNSSCTYAAAFALRQRMLNFVQNLEYYNMFEVIEPSWHAFLAKMQEVTNVDEVLTVHSDFVNNCLKDCMLTDTDLLQTVIRLLKLCVSFASFMMKTHRFAVEAETMSSMVDSSTFSVAGAQDVEEEAKPASSQMSFQQRITAFHAEFTHLLRCLLNLISDRGRNNYNEKMVNMLYRLDFNSFYIKKSDRFQLWQNSNTLKELKLK